MAGLAAVAIALVPVFAVILIGLAMRRLRFPGENFWPAAEKLVYFVLFPALLFRTIAGADLTGVQVGPMAATLLSALAVLILALLAARPLLARNGPAFTSVFQGATRFNTYVGLAAAAALFEAEVVAAFALCIAVMVPVLNLACVAVLSLYGARSGGGGFLQLLWRTARDVARNPLILACLAGGAMQLAGLSVPRLADELLFILARAALPLGLLAVGAALTADGLAARFRPVAFACAGKLLLFPLLIAGAATLFGLTGASLTAAILWGVLPTSPAAYVLARQLGGDAETMAAAVTATTVVAFVTMPVMLGWLL
ncbi:MAG: AEC family transporter [Sneathiellaceae bacterium]